jgi:protein arginine kinase activator
MLCNVCGKHNATIYFKGVAQDQIVKLHLCATCAKKKGMVFPYGESISPLGDMVAALTAALSGPASSLALRCKQCGLTYPELRESSQLGCAHCYEAFQEVLGPLLKRIQGSDQHIGKTYRRTVRAVTPMEDLARMKVELRDAVKKEQYERAATLRDEIRALEKKLIARMPQPQ